MITRASMPLHVCGRSSRSDRRDSGHRHDAYGVDPHGGGVPAREPEILMARYGRVKSGGPLGMVISGITGLT